MSHRAWRVSALTVCLAAALVAVRTLREPAPPVPIPVQRIDLNTAPAERLQLLQGIGPTLAQRIVADRREHGPFATLDDVDRVPRIGPRTLRAIAPDATLSHAAP